MRSSTSLLPLAVLVLSSVGVRAQTVYRRPRRRRNIILGVVLGIFALISLIILISLQYMRRRRMRAASRAHRGPLPFAHHQQPGAAPFNPHQPSQYPSYGHNQTQYPYNYPTGAPEPKAEYAPGIAPAPPYSKEAGYRSETQTHVQQPAPALSHLNAHGHLGGSGRFQPPLGPPPGRN